MLWLSKPTPEWGPAIELIPKHVTMKNHETMIPLNLTPLCGTPNISTPALYVAAAAAANESAEAADSAQATLMHSVAPRVSSSPSDSLPVIYDGTAFTATPATSTLSVPHNNTSAPV